LSEWNNLQNLTNIYCPYNLLTKLPDWDNFLNLKEIDCQRNLLTTLPEWNNLLNLEIIVCRNNQITYLPEWNNLINLERIDCQSNLLTTLPVSLSTLQHLNNIIYYNNPIEYIPINLFRRLDRQITQNIYNDNQNVHNHNIQECLKKSINYLLKDKPILSFDDVQKDINNRCICITKDLLLEYSNENEIHSILNVTFADILIAVWNKIYIFNKSIQEEIIKVLNIEILDSKDKCFTGRITRLVNVLNGFDPNIRLEISENEQKSNISKKLYDLYPNVEDYMRELRIAFIERGYSEIDIQEWYNIL
jgi:hypothetical protein